MPNKNRPSKKRQAILQTAEQMFRQFGFKRISVEEICREAGASKMTFYKYFSNKTDLVRQIKDGWMEEAFSKFEEIKALDIPFSEKIQTMTQWKMEFSAKISARFLQDVVSLDEDLAELKRRYLANIAEAQKQGEIRAEINREFLWLVLDKINDLVREGTYKKVCSEFSEFQYQLRTLVYYGLLTRSEEQTVKNEKGDRS